MLLLLLRSTDGVATSTGALVATFAAAALVATGTAPVAGTVAKSLDAATVVAAGKARAGGALAKSLAPAAVAATGKVRTSGALAKPLAPAALSATGQARASGALAKSLAPASVAASGKARTSAASAPTLGGMHLTAAGAVRVSGQESIALGDTTLAASASVESTGALSGVLESTTLSATGMSVVVGTVSKVLDHAGLSADGYTFVSGAPVTGTASIALSNATVVSTGLLTGTPLRGPYRAPPPTRLPVPAARMIKVIAFKVRSLDVDFLELSWKITDTTDDVLDYDMQILRSESAAGPWDAITGPFQDRYRFFDRLTNQFHNWRAFFYKLVVTHRVTGQTEEYGPIQQQAEADLITMELRRHFNILFREFSGRRCWIIPARTFGQRCTACWDKVLNKKTRSGCGGCFDTGFARGYLSPIEVFAQVESGSPDVAAPNAPGKNSARIVDVGNAKPRDILIEGENNRWRIEAVNDTEHGRAPILIDLSLQKIPPSDIEYRIPLNLDAALKDVFLSPPRNFTNPHNLQSFEDEEIPRVFTLYGRSYPER